MTNGPMPHQEPEETIRTTCSTHHDSPDLQKFVLEMLHDDVPVARLEALRIAIHCYDPIADADSVVHAFDMQSQLSYDLADALRRRRRSFGETVPGDVSMGLIGITMITVEAPARGSRASHRLIDHLRDLHSGMGWHAALDAVPMEFKEGPDPAFRAMRSRLVEHYSASGFKRISPRGSPGLMGAFWDGMRR